MYTEFFELIEKPFSLATSPRFLYLGEKHKEALSILRYGVMERQGFVLITGEVGTGKTTMVRALISSLDTGVKYVHLANPLLSPKEFINYLILSSFDNQVHLKTKPEFLIAFETFLTKLRERDMHFLLVIDEAHKLSFELLEEIRLLSNLETAEEKLISIFLVGQPELNEHLSEPMCRPLLQRISVRYHIPPLDVQETREYVMTRMQKAGSKRAEEIFPKKTLDSIHQYSQGYPRVINIIADNCLLLGYSKGESRISPAMVKSCYQDLGLGPSEDKAGGLKRSSGQDRRSGVGFRWGWAVGALLIGILASILAFLAVRYGDQILSGFVSASVKTPKPESETVRKEGVTIQTEPKRAAAPAPVVPVSEKQPPAVEVVKAEVEEGKKEMPSAPVAEKPGPSEVGDGPSEVRSEPVGKTIVVERGDTLLELSSRVYGKANERVLEIIQKNNPAIRDPDFILPGQKLHFPPLPEAKQ